MANEKMTLDKFVQKYGTDGASELLDKLVSDCLDIQECHSPRMRELLDAVSLMADELKEALTSSASIATGNDDREPNSSRDDHGSVD